MRLRAQPNFVARPGEVVITYVGSQPDHRKFAVAFADELHHVIYLNCPEEDGSKGR